MGQRDEIVFIFRLVYLQLQGKSFWRTLVIMDHFVADYIPELFNYFLFFCVSAQG